ncbi:MAG: hypothetical protein J6U51_06975, partial [Bacteroidales bacterium]|nr:hypothetical protein [Bacteroidales bacterium]
MIVNKFNGNGGGGSYTLPTATESRLGGVKIGSGITVQNDGTISASGNTYTLPAATSEVLGGVKIGEGISIDSAGTISVSGVSAEEKYFVVDALSAVTNPTEGMAVYVKGEEITGYTILCDTTELENYSWEPGRNFINIDGNDYEFAPVGNLMPGKWRTMSFIGFSDLMARIRMTAEKYTILDVIDSGNTHTIAAGSDMVSITSGITYPMKGSIYVYASGRRNRKSQFEWDNKQSEAAGVYSAI